MHSFIYNSVLEETDRAAIKAIVFTPSLYIYIYVYIKKKEKIVQMITHHLSRETINLLFF